MAECRPGLDYPAITCAFLCHDGHGRFLLHRRSLCCRDEQGTWDAGAGALELGETLDQAVEREVREEYRARARDIRMIDVRDVLRVQGGILHHWVAVVFAVLVDPTEVAIGEPEKMDSLGWFSLDTLPSPLHSQLVPQIESYRAAGVV